MKMAILQATTSMLTRLIVAYAIYRFADVGQDGGVDLRIISIQGHQIANFSGIENDGNQIF